VFDFPFHIRLARPGPQSGSNKEGTAIRYHVIYRTDGEETMTHVEAPDAATAVAAVQCVQRQEDAACELLSVVLDDNRELE
jgi:hypothetical protein